MTIVKKIFQEADDKLGFSISKLILEGPTDELQLTKNTQPAILTVSYSIFKVLKNEFDFDFTSFNYFAGHSLGEYSALVCSKSLDFTDAFIYYMKEVKQCKKLFQSVLGSMIAVLGLKTNEIEDLLKQIIKN